MDIPPYWLREERRMANVTLHLRGSSHVSMEDAKAFLEERAAIVAGFFAEMAKDSEEVEEFRQALRDLDNRHTGGGYCVEMFEPIVEQVDADNIITRNNYGSEVLNSTNLCMLDVDSFPDGVPFFTKLLAKVRLAEYDPRQAGETALMAALEKLCRQEPDLGARLYRTHSGWRVILQGDGLGYDSERMQTLSSLLHADPLYVNLCRKQCCWRARLTPKYRRLLKRAAIPAFHQRMVSNIPADGEAAWLAAYNQACKGVAVCRLVESFGRTISSPVLDFHDRRTFALSPDLPLF